MAGRKFIKALIYAILFNLFFGVLFYLVEKPVQPTLTLPDSIWWSMVTMTTVGYGDFSAQTFIGRFIVSYAVMLLGIGIIGYLVGLLAEDVLDSTYRKRKGWIKMKKSGHLIICNFPGVEKIQSLMEELKAVEEFSHSKFVLVSDSLDELPEVLNKQKVMFIKGTPTDEDTWKRANVFESKGVFILAEDPDSPSSDERTYAIGSILEMISRQEGREIRTIVELLRKENYKFMLHSEVDGIIFSDSMTSRLLVQEFLNPGTHDLIHQLTSNLHGSQLYIYNTALTGVSIEQIQVAVIKHPANMQVIGLIRGDEKILNPPKQSKIQAGDKLVILADSKQDFDVIEQELKAV